MQISSKHLLNSAEGILKERKNVAQESAPQQGAEKAASRAGGMTQGMLESRLLGLQDNLRDAQVQYSREQARFKYITENPDQIDSSLTFQNEALFPELEQGQRPADLQQQVAGAMEQLARSLKSMQVEMENLYALNFSALPRTDLSAESLSEQGVMRDLDPGRVSQLTRNN